MRAVRPGPSGSRKEPPRIRTITSATAREYTREFLSPAELQPYEVAEILGSDIDAGLSPQPASAAPSARKSRKASPPAVNIYPVTARKIPPIHVDVPFR